jgi:hypothetical protein
MSWAKPSIAFMGVRISCDILARKMLLARFAASAASLLACRAASARLRSVMSADTHRMPTGIPFASRRKVMVFSRKTVEPFL